MEAVLPSSLARTPRRAVARLPLSTPTRQRVQTVVPAFGVLLHGPQYELPHALHSTQAFS